MGNHTQDAGSAPRESQRPLILIVEDDPDIANLIRHQLANEYRFAFAGTGAEGLRLARELRPDAITLDIGLPDIEGDAVLRRLVADPVTRMIPVVIVSVRGDEVPADVPASAVLTKPVSRAALRRAMKAALAGRERRSG